MAVEIVMPRLGWTMEEGTLVEWLKKPGEAVQAGEVLFTVETDKAINEVESFDAGRLHIPADAPGPGATVAVGTVIGYLLAEGEEPPASASAPAAAGSGAGAPRQTPADSTAAPGGGTDSQAPPATADPSSAPAISPRARRLAQQLGIDWRKVRGTGRTGRITEDDVRAAAADQAAGSGSTES